MRARGLVIGEALVGAAVLGIVLILLLVVGDRQRRAMGLSQSTANLRQFAAAHVQYGNDSNGRVATFSWRVGDDAQSSFPDLRITSDDVDAAAVQAVDIMRRRGGGTAATMPRISQWIPHILYSHLPLVDYLGVASPSPWTVSPGDKPRLDWRRTNSSPEPSSASGYRWIHSTSYEFVPAFFVNDFGTPSGSVPTLAQSSTYSSYALVGNLSSVIGRRRYDEVLYPSSKVMMFETFQRFFGPRDAFGLYPEARVPALLSDASVVVRRTEEANAGANPTRPTSAGSMAVNYGSVSLWEPAPLYSTSDSMPGRFRWTRFGMRGRDFDGPETTTPP